MKAEDKQDETEQPLSKYHYVLGLTSHLDRISSALRILGVLTLLLTLCGLGALVGQVISSALIGQSNQIGATQASTEGTIFYRQYLSYWWLVGILIVFTFTLAILGTSDLLRRRADAIFQEVSNTFQGVEKGTSLGLELQSELMTRARISLRSFASSADPPLIRGRYGAGIYALANVIIVLIAVILYAQVA